MAKPYPWTLNDFALLESFEQACAIQRNNGMTVPEWIPIQGLPLLNGVIAVTGKDAPRIQDSPYWRK